MNQSVSYQQNPAFDYNYSHPQNSDYNRGSYGPIISQNVNYNNNIDVMDNSFFNQNQVQNYQPPRKGSISSEVIRTTTVPNLINESRFEMYPTLESVVDYTDQQQQQIQTRRVSNNWEPQRNQEIGNVVELNNTIILDNSFMGEAPQQRINYYPVQSNHQSRNDFDLNEVLESSSKYSKKNEKSFKVNRTNDPFEGFY